MSGRIVVLILVVTALVGGAAMYWLQVFAFYERLDPAEVTLRVTRAGTAAPLPVTALRAIDAASSPIRFRACFDVGSGTGGDPYPEAVPLNAPFWFGCFDAARIGADLAAGRAVAVLGQKDVVWGVDRVLALYPDGRGYAWHQINRCGEEVFDGRPAPQGCPAPPSD